LKTLWFV